MFFHQFLPNLGQNLGTKFGTKLGTNLVKKLNLPKFCPNFSGLCCPSVVHAGSDGISLFAGNTIGTYVVNGTRTVEFVSGTISSFNDYVYHEDGGDEYCIHVGDVSISAHSLLSKY